MSKSVHNEILAGAVHYCERKQTEDQNGGGLGLTEASPHACMVGTAPHDFAQSEHVVTCP